MLSKIFLSIVFATTAVQAYVGTIHVFRDMNPVVNIRQDVQPFGCVTLRPGWSSDGAKRLGVSGSATDAECAKFEITREGDFSRNGKKFRFKELSTGKLMEHSGDWIYLAGDPQDKTAKTLFIVEDYIYWPTGDHNAMLRPSDSNHRIYAQYDSGDLNTKHSGFRMFVKLV